MCIINLTISYYINIIITIHTYLDINICFDQIHISDLILLTLALREVHGDPLAPARACVQRNHIMRTLGKLGKHDNNPLGFATLLIPSVHFI